MYETFEHTADIGLRMRGETLTELFEEAGRALFSVLVANLDAVRPVREFKLRVEADRHDDLLLDWLAELLFLHQTEHVLLVQFEVAVDGGRLSAACRGETIDPARHELEMDVKAITYHGLKVLREEEGWLGEVIVDL